ncbi:hypothetical protein [Mesorhizobium sp. B263B2A]|uniref:hypothetical protein n=1 Tax=Mesorhizobium sp. B263B2A TaxID=2876669 RepID=UPI001CD0B9B3|nr:hypothetical protein [Mesorhizobium sp. B263B2A]MCA0032724.1 hypothetical protein [Mesorhizobium sp. B263B2A]
MVKAAKKSAAPAGEGHNSSGDTADLDRKVLFHINRQNWLKALAAKKAADAALKNVCKVVKSDLGEFGMTQIKDYEKAQTPEGKAELQAKQAATRQAMAWAGIPVNTQLDMLVDLAPLEERAYQDGLDAGLRGDTLSNPFNPLSAEGQAFEKGWHDGQGALFAGIKKKEEAASDELIHGDGHEDPFGEEDEQREAAE